LDGSPESALWWIGSLKENYIMIFDNADILSPAALEVYFPPGIGGNILITSCNSAMTLTSPQNSLEVTEMEERDAIGLLLKASCLESSTSDVQIQASKIVTELYCFPLAIDQAGAYIASGATTIGDYLEKYSEHRKTLLSHSEFTGASKYNRTVYETWELSYKEIQQRAKSDDSCKADAANSAILLLELFPFFHHEGITQEIFSYSALSKDDKTPMSNLPLASSLLDQRLLPVNKSGTWDNFVFREGLRTLLSFSLIKRGPSDCVYAMHPLVHTWGRDRLTLNERKECCLIAYATLSCSLRWDAGQPYGFQRTLVTHVRANMEYFKSEGNETIISYMDDAYAKFGRLLMEQGYSKEAETLQIKVLDERNKVLGVGHPDTILAMGELAATYSNIGKYKEAEKLEIQVLDARKRILGVGHPHTIRAMGKLAVTYYDLGQYTDSEKLEIQVLDASNRILGLDHPDTIFAMGNLAVTYGSMGKYKEAEKVEIQVLDARKRILGVEHPDTMSDFLNLAYNWYLPVTTIQITGGRLNGLKSKSVWFKSGWNHGSIRLQPGSLY
jgi:tetratricopeptide (TPR) repeat protein